MLAAGEAEAQRWSAQFVPDRNIAKKQGGPRFLTTQLLDFPTVPATVLKLQITKTPVANAEDRNEGIDRFDLTCLWRFAIRLGGVPFDSRNKPRLRVFGAVEARHRGITRHAARSASALRTPLRIPSFKSEVRFFLS